MRNNIKQRLAVAAAVVLAISQAGTAFAGTWNGAGNAWKYQLDDGSFAPGGWFKDPADGKMYYLDENGMLTSGWKLLNGKWYFLNTTHDGTFGAMLSGGWQWIDGYCYLFGQDGAMYAGCITPDGFTVNADGQWMVEGVPVYMAGKGILTKSQPVSSGTARSSGGGGGGGGGGSTHSSGYSNYHYEVRILDENGAVLNTRQESAGKGSKIVIEAEPVDGYDYVGGDAGEHTLDTDGAVYTLRYRNRNLRVVTVEYYDNATGEKIGGKQVDAMIGSTVSLEGFCPDGYEPSGTQPGSFTVSEAPENNTVKLYFNKIKESPAPAKKQAPWVVKYVSYDDPSLEVLPQLEGVGIVGEKLSVEIQKEFTDREGRTWRTDDDSPRVFNIEEVERNEFIVRYHLIGRKETPDMSRTYSITYVVEDTGSILGVSAGVGNVGDTIPYRNTFEEYSLYDGEQSCRITDAAVNSFTARLRRAVADGPKKDPLTGKYEGYQWLVLFVDGRGQELLPRVSGWTEKEDEFVIDFPEVIEGDGVTYRAQQTTPFRFPAGSTVYRQFVIRYTTGETSDTKLAQWKAKAQEKKDEFFGSEPRGYYTVYKERISRSDIGLKLGVGYAGEDIKLSAESFDGYRPYGELGSFLLNEEGQMSEASYEKEDGESVGDVMRQYRIRFTDGEGHDLFEPYTGEIAFETEESSNTFRVYYPEMFYDVLGNRWDADTESPAEYSSSALSNGDFVLDEEISFHLVYENPGDQFIVKNSGDVSRILLQYASSVNDTDRHELYLIGQDYDPTRAEISESAYLSGLTGCTQETVDTFALDGVSYHVTKISFAKKWEQDDRECDHEWEYESLPDTSCSSYGYADVQCLKCGMEIHIKVPATGHTDTDYDGLCDTCGAAMGEILGDEITVRWTPSGLGEYITDPDYSIGEDIEYHFILIDNDYNGTGKCLYLCEDDVTPEVYGVYAAMMKDRVSTPSDAERADAYTDTDSAAYGSSNLRQFLDDSFRDGLSVKNALLPMEDAYVSMLTKEEYDSYKQSLKGEVMFPDGVFLTKDNDMDTVTLTDGTEADPEEAASYPARPVILMDAGDSVDSTDGYWREGDLQLREIGGKKYLFRCVDSEYSGKTSVSRNLALFICDTVIPADEGLGFDGQGMMQTRFFSSGQSGKNANNYKYSDVLEWLNDNCPAAKDLVGVNVGVANEYTGSSPKGTYSDASIASFTKHPRGTDQTITSKLFILSLEEALAVKDYLWKFDCSERDNPEKAVSEYCTSYWLRTPEYGTTDKVYAVNLVTGAIEPTSAVATEENPICMTGIRPAYVVAQGE